MSRGFIFTLILTFVSVFVWIQFGGTHLFKTTRQDSFATKSVKSINPELRIDITQDL